MPSPVEIAVDTYIRACLERDVEVRAELFRACLADDVRMVTSSREIRGRAALIHDLTRFLDDPRLLRIRLLKRRRELNPKPTGRANCSAHAQRAASKSTAVGRPAMSTLSWLKRQVPADLLARTLILPELRGPEMGMAKVASPSEP